MRRAVLHLKKADPVLKGLIERVGPCRIAYRPPDFDTLVRSIVYQQLSGKVAARIFARMQEAAGASPLTSEALALSGEARLRAAGLSERKVSYVRGLAHAARGGELDFNVLLSMSDAQVIASLTRYSGVGVWTAHMFLIFALRRPNVLPTSDLGVRTAIRREYGLDELPKPAQVEAIARPWRPYCSIASWYLWRSLDGAAGI